MATAHSPVPDVLFYLFLLAVAGLSGIFFYFMPHILISAFLGSGMAILIGWSLEAHFYKFLGKFDIWS